MGTAANRTDDPPTDDNQWERWRHGLTPDTVLAYVPKDRNRAHQRAARRYVDVAGRPGGRAPWCARRVASPRWRQDGIGFEGGCRDRAGGDHDPLGGDRQGEGGEGR